MRFTTDPREIPVKVRWYFVDEGTPFLPFPTNYTLYERWSPEREYWNDLGEVYNSFKVRANRPGPQALPGDKPCGSAARFIGQTWPYTHLAYDNDGALCCHPNSGVFNLKVGLKVFAVARRGSAFIVSAEPRVVVTPGLTFGRVVRTALGFRVGWSATLRSVRSHNWVAEIGWKIAKAIFFAIVTRILQRLRVGDAVVRTVFRFFRWFFRSRGLLLLGRGVLDRGGPAFGFGATRNLGRRIAGEGPARVGFGATFQLVRLVPARNGIGLGIGTPGVVVRLVPTLLHVRGASTATFAQPESVLVSASVVLGTVIERGVERSMFDPSKCKPAATFSAVALKTPSGGCGSLPATMVLRTGNNASCSCMSNRTVTLTWNSMLSNWQGSDATCGGTVNYTLNCLSGTWKLQAGGAINPAMISLSGTSGANPNLTGTLPTSTFAPGCTGNVAVTITRT